MQLIKDRLELSIIDTVFDPDVYGFESLPRLPDNKTLAVRVDESGNLPLYKVWLFLTGNDLAYVESTTYQLHSSFSNSVRTVERNVGNLDCRLVIWTWGIFQINATILHKSGRTYSLSHELQYGQLLERYQATGDVKINYLRENSKDKMGAKLNPS
jgi:hypothetical protein